MGTRKDPAGISVQLYDTNGKPDGDPYFGRFVELYGRPQGEVVDIGGRVRSEEENNTPGSGDWLTLVAVADTPERLKDLVDRTSVEKTESHTSHSSHRVLVELHVGDVRTTLEDRITIASGPIVSIKPPIINVVHLKVLAAGTKFDQTHPLHPEFVGGTPFTQ